MSNAFANASARSGPTPLISVTGNSASRPSVTATLLFDSEEERVQRLPPVVDLSRDVGVLIPEPLRHCARGSGRATVTLDDRDDLVVVGDELGQQRDGRTVQLGVNGDD